MSHMEAKNHVQIKLQSSKGLSTKNDAVAYLVLVQKQMVSQSEGAGVGTTKQPTKMMHKAFSKEELTSYSTTTSQDPIERGKKSISIYRDDMILN